MKKLLPAIVTGLTLFAQGISANPDHGARRYASPAVAGQTLGRSFPAIGTVRKVDRENGIVTIFHQPVAALKWPSMTMPFAVDDKAMFDRLKVGEQVEFEFARDGNHVVITHIK